METCIVIPLLFLIDSDFRKRTVRGDILFVFGFLQLIIACMKTHYMIVLSLMAVNTLSLLIWGAGLLFYFSLSRRRFVLSLREEMGAGDLWFILCLVPAFGTIKFIIFLLSGFILSFFYWCFYLFRTDSQSTVPLVSTLGVCYIIFLLIDSISYIC